MNQDLPRGGPGAGQDHPAPVGPDRAGQRAPLDEARVLSRFGARALAHLVEAALPRRVLAEFAQKLALRAPPGFRLQSMNSLALADLLADAALEGGPALRGVVERLNRHLPEPLFDLTRLGGGPSEPPGSDELERWAAAGRLMDREARLRLFVALLPVEALAGALNQLLVTGFLAPDPELGPGEAPRRAVAKPAAAPPAGPARERAAQEARDKALQQRVDALKHEAGELQEKLGRRNREVAELHGQISRLKQDLEIAFRRAARHKRALDEARAPGEREQKLREELSRERQRADIEAAKVEVLEYQLDLHQLDDETARPARPADARAEAREEQRLAKLAEAVARRSAERGVAPRVLVIGGAGKQRSHRDHDFERLKRRLGFQGEWRFAEYGSWHRELPRLRNDLRGRFDLVFVLHWNRTTFVQKMHDEARAANARVRTVPYRGFLSLERALVEELERYLAEPA